MQVLCQSANRTPVLNPVFCTLFAVLFQIIA